MNLTLGQRIKVRRQELKLTQEDVAKRFAVSKPTVWAWEQGRADPIPSRYSEIAEFLGIPIDELETPIDPGNLALIIDRAREDIAAAAGVTGENVRIFIEL